MNSKITIGLLLISVIFIAGCTSTTQTNNTPTVCTQDALICPDGSAVGRHGPNCEFDKCPTNTSQLPGTLPPVSTLPTPPVKEFNMTAMRFAFEPSTVTVNKGDQVVLHVTSTDVTHGISLPDYNILQTLPPGETKTMTFIADKAGQFTFFCSVLCGSGHSSMTGKLIVNP